MNTVVVGDVIKDAYLFAGIGDQYNPLDADSVNLALRFLNDLADSYSTDALKVFNLQYMAIPLTVGERAYTSADAEISPVLLGPIQAGVIDSISIRDAGNIAYPVRIVSSAEWQAIVSHDAPGRPNRCLVFQDNDQTSFWFWPTPSFDGDKAAIFVWNPLAQFSAVGDTFEAPPGYRLFFKTALAKVLASLSKVQLSKDQNDVIDAAALTMKARNSKRRILGLDVPQDRMAGAWFNIFTGYPN